MRACLIVALAVIAAVSSASSQTRAPRDPQIQRLVADARSAPPEFAADVLVRLAASPKVVDSVWKRELLEEAYGLTFAAPEPYRRLTAPIPIDSRQSAQARGSDSALSRVSLQVRIAQMMAFVDPARAREIFEWIDLDLEPGVCDAALAPAVDEYYSALAVLAVGSSRVDLQACKLEYSIVSPK